MPENEERNSQRRKRAKELIIWPSKIISNQHSYGEMDRLKSYERFKFKAYSCLFFYFFQILTKFSTLPIFLHDWQGCGSCPHVGSPDSDPPNRLIYIYDEIGSTSTKLAFELVIEDLIEDLLSVGWGICRTFEITKDSDNFIKDSETSLVWMKRE